MAIKKLRPFKLWVLQNFPFIAEDFDALTNYELMCKIVEYLNNVINVTNEQTIAIQELEEKFNELKDYIDHYFDTLDLQEEVNNKLDEMAESGELEEIISQYLQLGAVLSYNTIADMIASENLTAGSVVRTLGRNEINDLKGATYKIIELQSHVADGINTISLGRDDLYAQLIYENKIIVYNTLQDLKSANDLTIYNYVRTLGYYNINDGGQSIYYIVNSLEDGESANDGNIVELQNNLYAKLITDKEINIKQFGAKGNDIDDDYLSIQNALDYANSNNLKNIFIPTGTYKLSDSLTLPVEFNHINIYGENKSSTVLKMYDLTDNKPILIINGGSGSLTENEIKNISFSTNSETYTTIGIQINGSGGNDINHCSFNNLKVGILNNNSGNNFSEFNVASNCVFHFCYNALKFQNSGTQYSFNGCGIKDSIIQETANTGNPIYIDRNCCLYNAILDFMIFIGNSNSMVYLNGNSSGAAQTRQITAQGHIRTEGNTQKYVFDGQNINAIYFNGDLQTFSENVTLSSVENAWNIRLTYFTREYSNGSIYGLSKPLRQNKNIDKSTGTASIRIQYEDDEVYEVVLAINTNFYKAIKKFTVCTSFNPSANYISSIENIKLFDQTGIDNRFSFTYSNKTLTVTYSGSDYGSRDINIACVANMMYNPRL